MIFSVKRFALLGLATTVAPVVPFNSPRAVLQCFRVTVAPGSLVFAGTDTDQAVVASTGLVSTEDSMEFLVPAHKLTEVLQAAPEGDVTVETGSKLAPGTATVSAGSSEWTLALKSGLGEFPALPDVSAVEWEQTPRAPFLAALKSVRHAVSRDARPALACVNVVRATDGTARAGAYDGSRFQQMSIGPFPFAMQIPAAGTPSAVDEVIRLLSGNADLEQAEVAVTGKKLLFRAGSVVFATGPHLARTADAEAELLVPALASANQGLTVQRDALLAAIRRVRVSADAETSAIGLRLGSSEVIVLARDKSGNSAQEAVDATWEGKDGRLVVLNHRYLSEALGAHPGAQCEFRLGPDAGRKRSLVLLRDKDAGADAVLMQGHPKSLGLT